MTNLLIGGWSYSTAFMRHSWPDEDIVPFPRAPASFTTDPDIVIGWSLGGLLAMQAIVEGRLKPSALVLISSTARFCNDDAYSCGVPRAALRSMMTGLRRNRAATLSAFYRDATAPEAMDGLDLQARLVQSGEFTDTELLDGLKKLDEIDIRPNLGAIALPVLILHGAHDHIIPREAADYLCNNLDRAEMHIHDTAGHELISRQSNWLHERIARFAEGI